MKPVGLADPRTGRRPYAVVQLRQDNLAGDHFSLVGFQTQLKWGEQARVLRMIPGLERAEFVRFGMVHRNTYINGPTVLRETWQTKRRDDLFFAGQISGVEGYVESAASGLLAGINAAALALGGAPRAAPRTTAIGALAYYVSHASAGHYQPSNITFGIMEPLAVAAAEQARPEDGPLRARAGRPRPMDGGRRRQPAAMREHLKAFLEYLRGNRGASPHTVRAYESDLAQFLAFLPLAQRQAPRRAAAGGLRRRGDPVVPRRAVPRRIGRGRPRRASSPRSARSCGTCGARA